MVVHERPAGCLRVCLLTSCAVGKKAIQTGTLKSQRFSEGKTLTSNLFNSKSPEVSITEQSCDLFVSFWGAGEKSHTINATC